jgi:parallel beta-helix repeat protein
MKTRYLFVSLALSVGLIVVLLCILGSGSVPAVAAPPSSGSVARGNAVPNAPADELLVCLAGPPTCDYASVQDAVDAALWGDVIKVAAGTYPGVSTRSGVTQTVYVSKTVTIRGGYTTANWATPDPDINLTILDAQGRGRVFYITGDTNPVIEGLRITGGDAYGLGGGSEGWDAGGGLYIVDATATINNNRVYGCSAFAGGGLYLRHSSATLSGNTISFNTVTDNGGGLYLYDSDATLSANTIFSNVAIDDGGGLYLHSSGATLSGNDITSNTATDDGGGLCLFLSDGTLNANTISGNRAGAQGGGLYLQDSDSTLNGNTITDNRAVFGGALYVRVSSASLDSNVIADNQATTVGSGMYVESSALHLRHNTLARNTDGDGSGVYITAGGVGYSTVALTNTILVSHTVGIFVEAGNAVTLEATLWGDGVWANEVDRSGTGSISAGMVNIHSEPAFAKAGDYHLTASSAAVDNGIGTGVSTDVDLDLRPIGGGFDIGADEFPVVVTTSQDISITLVYTDPGGSLTELEIPAGAVTDTITIVYTPKDSQVALPLPENMVLGAHVFDLDVYRNDVHIPHFTFLKVMTLTSEYTDADVVGMIEDTLALYRGPGIEAEWIGMRPGESQTRDVENNLLTAYLLSTSRFREMGEGIACLLFLPLAMRDG